MEERPPSRPRVAWEASESSQESSSVLEPFEVCEVEPLQSDASWLPVYEEEEEAVDFIKDYIKNKERDDVQKMKLLRNIVTVFTTAQEKGLLEGLDTFCRENKLTANIQVLLEEKPIDYPCTDLWEEALLATSALSTVETVLEGEMLSLVAACVSSVFFLLRTEDLDAWFTMTILQKMDVMLRTLLIRPPASSLGDKLQSILKLLLEFTTSSSRAVQVNAAERIWNLFAFLYNCCSKEPFGKYLQPSQRTAIILKTLDIMSSYSTEDDEHFGAEFMVDIAVEDPATWLMDVPKILRFIHESLSNCRDSDHQKLFSVLSTMANQFPREVLLSILTDLPTLDSTTLDIWKAMLSLPVTSEKILQELRNVLQDNEVCSFFAVSAADLSIFHFAMMYPTHQLILDLCAPETLCMCLRLQSLPMLWMMLRALDMLSETPEMGGKFLVLLPDVMNTLQYDNTHITMKALTIFKNVIRDLEKKEASPIALALAGRLLPLFNDVSSEVRECSVLLFKDLMESVLWWKKGEMKKTVHRAIIPLLFRMRDNTESVAKASAEVLLACAKFLKWKQLEQLAQTEDISKIGGYLLKQKRSRVEGYLQQSLTYLEDDQTSLRKMAVKFVGFAVGSAGIRSEEKLNELIQALQLVVKDVDSSVCITAAHTILKLRSRIKTPIPLWDRLAECCCWPCIARANDSV
nr:uncharacterized protein LOC113841892 isoform X1 [Anas platyrhynchos]